MGLRAPSVGDVWSRSGRVKSSRSRGIRILEGSIQEESKSAIQEGSVQERPFKKARNRPFKKGHSRRVQSRKVEIDHSRRAIQERSTQEGSKSPFLEGPIKNGIEKGIRIEIRERISESDPGTYAQITLWGKAHSDSVRGH